MDLYTLSLRTYAWALAGHMDEARTGLAQLMERAKRTEKMIYWQHSGECMGVGVDEKVAVGYYCKEQ